jgi:hypothetical protein
MVNRRIGASLDRTAFRPVFGQFVMLCRQMRLFGNDLIAVDGTRIKAVNNKAARPTLRDGSQAVLGDERQKLERTSLRVFLAPFPLADEAGCDVKIAGKNGLAGALAFAQGANFIRRQGTHGGQTRIVEPAHRLLVHHAGRV